jgi:hypothetical protein
MEERFRLTLDLASIVDLSDAISVGMNTISQNPQQEVGNGGAIVVRQAEKDFTVVRNEDSYTVRT